LFFVQPKATKIMLSLLKNSIVVFLATILLQLAADSCDAEVIAHWRFESGNFLADSSGNGHTLTGTATPSVDVANASGGSGSALFNGATSLQTAAALDLSSFGQLRVSFAMRNTSAALGVILEHTANYNSNEGAFLFDTNELGAGLGSVVLNLTAAPTHGEQLPHATGQWDLYQIDMIPTAVSAADVIQITRNGTQLADAAAFGLHGTTAAHAFLNDIFYIGARAGSGFPFNGNIDEILIEAPPFGPVIPEPSTLLLAVFGLLGLTGIRRRRR
jgi:hypothetical protein